MRGHLVGEGWVLLMLSRFVEPVKSRYHASIPLAAAQHDPVWDVDALSLKDCAVLVLGAFQIAPCP